ncbi:Nucleoside-diphosphate-sugar epimerase [Mesorhizobium sp. YR577]|nr:Nucleoside-diphosphate-sugar epimerase [Mesorhizobium sp. YR577]
MVNVMTQTVLVTGGNGFVGGWCIVELLRQGFAVRATVRDMRKAEAARVAVGTQTSTDRLSFVVADLMQDDGWDAAMVGIDYVMHVASPLPMGALLDREALVPAARDGTLRVLRAAVKAGVKRVVMTSASATTRQPLNSNTVSNETMWADPADPQFDAYRVSKIRAEKAAWEFIGASGGKTELATILPGAVFGPVLTTDSIGSVKIIKDLLAGRPAAMPQLGFWVVDVRDLADAHVRAMTSAKAGNERLIVAGSFLWMAEIAKILREKLGAKTPTPVLPNWVVRLLVPFMADLRTLAPLVGRKFEMDTGKARRVLGIVPRPIEETLVDCAGSLTAASD